MNVNINIYRILRFRVITVGYSFGFCLDFFITIIINQYKLAVKLMNHMQSLDFIPHVHIFKRFNIDLKVDLLIFSFYPFIDLLIFSFYFFIGSF